VSPATAQAKAVLHFAGRHRAPFIFFGIVLLVWVLQMVVPPPAPETPEQIQARRTAQLAQAKAQAAATARQRALCNQQTICTKFATARQECATAGNYKNCVDIKMGKDAMDLYPCMNDGRVWGEPADMPNRFQCFIQSIQ
jgi:hypothetical protein